MKRGGGGCGGEEEDVGLGGLMGFEVGMVVLEDEGEDVGGFVVG